MNLNDKHISSSFDAEVRSVCDRMRQMGGQVESQLAVALHALTQLDEKSAAQVLAQEARVNAMEVEIDRDLVAIIARRQPAGCDLRLLIAISKLTGHLENIGNEAASIARVAQRLADTGMMLRLPLQGVASSARLVGGRLRIALRAFAQLDTGLALQALEESRSGGQELDRLMRAIVDDMVENPRMISASTGLAFVARSIERVDEHVRHLAGQTLRVVRGDEPSQEREAGLEAGFA